MLELKLASILILTIAGIYTVFIIKKISQGIKNEAKESKIEKSGLDDIYEAIEDANKMTEDLNKLAKGIFMELDSKYEELLIIYKLIDEKKKEYETNNNSKEEMELEYSTNKKTEVEQILTFSNNEEKVELICKLYDIGMKNEEIAKKINVGIREVNLILDIRKV